MMFVQVVEIVKDKFGGREIYQVDTLDTGEIGMLLTGIANYPLH